jgi:hypothetical protein
MIIAKIVTKKDIVFGNVPARLLKKMTLFVNLVETDRTLQLIAHLKLSFNSKKLSKDRLLLTNLLRKNLIFYAFWPKSKVKMLKIFSI